MSEDRWSDEALGKTCPCGNFLTVHLRRDCAPTLLAEVRRLRLIEDEVQVISQLELDRGTAAPEEMERRIRESKARLARAGLRP